MAAVSTCCLKLYSSTPNSKPSLLAPSNHSKPNQISWEKKDKEGSWRSQCLMGMATCIIIALEMGPHALADEGKLMKLTTTTTAESERKVMRWSDERTCPPWKMNSWEIIVPENLPRPSAHRKSESVTNSNTAPTLRIIIKTKSNNGCFSM